ncbi:MAG: hypothetical protein Q8M98_11730 [Candidatus Cloacimonadaceae bacterium]|nr:hypothetical protein [Candidatus Cloacimonadaceae bacterium]
MRVMRLGGYNLAISSASELLETKYKPEPIDLSKCSRVGKQLISKAAETKKVVSQPYSMSNLLNLMDTDEYHSGCVDALSMATVMEFDCKNSQVKSWMETAEFPACEDQTTILGEKMSKSLNNFYTARDILKQHSAEAIRFFFLSKHYRSPIDFNRELIRESERAVKNFYDALKAIDYPGFADEQIEITNPDIAAMEQDFITAMDDDFNSARAIAVLFELASLIKNESLQDSTRKEAAGMLVRLGSALGFFQDLAARLADNMPDLSKQLVELILQYRSQAREDKNWALSDKIRDDLANLNIEIKDTKDGCTWSIGDKS